MFNSFNLDRVSIIALAMVATLPFIALSPAEAAPVDCAVEAQAITVQARADGVAPKDSARALQLVRVGEKICVEGSRFEAAKKFAAARAQLRQGVEFADRR